MSEGFNFVGQLASESGAVDQAVAHSAKATTYAAALEHVTAMWSMWLVAGLIIVFGFLARASLAGSKSLVPEKTLTLRNFFELLTEFLINLSDGTLGKENRRYLPFIATCFVFVLFMNVLGLVPGFVMPTHRVTVNAGLAIVVFVCYNFWGIREVGIVNYLKHLWGPVFFIGFLLFPIEVISHFIRPLSLSLRLFGNMTGDHMVLGVFTDLTKRLGDATGFLYLPIPVIFYFLGTMVCCIQAYIFALLTMIYIKLATAHEEHGEHHH